MIESEIHDEHDFVVTFKTSLVADCIVLLHVTPHIQKIGGSGKVVRKMNAIELCGRWQLEEFRGISQGLRGISCAEPTDIVGRRVAE